MNAKPENSDKSTGFRVNAQLTTLFGRSQVTRFDLQLVPEAIPDASTVTLVERCPWTGAEK